MEVAFFSLLFFFPEVKLSLFIFGLCCFSKLMEVRCTSATCTLRTPAPTPALPKTRLAWTRTSLRYLWKTLRGKLVCISHDGSLYFCSRDNGTMQMELLIIYPLRS